MLAYMLCLMHTQAELQRSQKYPNLASPHRLKGLDVSAATWGIMCCSAAWTGILCIMSSGMSKAWTTLRLLPDAAMHMPRSGTHTAHLHCSQHAHQDDSDHLKRPRADAQLSHARSTGCVCCLRSRWAYSCACDHRRCERGGLHLGAQRGAQWAGSAAGSTRGAVGATQCAIGSTESGEHGTQGLHIDSRHARHVVKGALACRRMQLRVVHAESAAWKCMLPFQGMHADSPPHLR